MLPEFDNLHVRGGLVTRCEHTHNLYENMDGIRKGSIPENYPPEKGCYLRGNDCSPVAVCVLLNRIREQTPPELQELVRVAVKSGAALAGTLQTENIGIEKVICNVVANPNVRYLLLCGDTTTVKHKMAKNSLPRKCKEGPSMTAQESKGFEITLHDAKHIVRVRTWGCWDMELAKIYGNALGEKIDEIRENDEEWCVLVDVTAFHPRSEDVQRMMCEHLETASKRGIKKIAYLGTRSVVQLRLNRLFREIEMPLHAFFESQDGALQWLLSE